MFNYRTSQGLAAFVGVAAGWALFTSSSADLFGFRMAMLLYSSILIFTISYFAQRNLVGQERYRRFGALLLLTSFGIYLTFLSKNLVIMGIGWSISGLGAALLVNHANLKRSRRASLTIGLNFLISDLCFWIAITLSEINHVNPFSAKVGESGHSSLLLNSIALLFAVSGIIRSGLFPAMRWLILTLEAPTPLSALLHAGIVNGFGYLLVVFPIIQNVRIFIVGVGLLTICVALAVMRHRHDEKGKLANGTSMQMAFMALEGILGIPGIVLLHIVGHGSYKSWSFLRAGGAPLRRKNAIPISFQVRPKFASVPLAITYLSSLGIAGWWLGDKLILNLTVGAIALASALIFSHRLPIKLMIPSIVLSEVSFFLYLAIVRAFSQIFSPHGEPARSLIVFIAFAIILITILIRLTPRTWTLRLSSRLYRYSSSRNKVERKEKLLGAGSDISKESLVEIIEVASSPFAGGGPLSEIVAQDPLVGLHNIDFASAAKISSEYGISLYSSNQQYLKWLENGQISREALGQCLREITEAITLDQLIAQTKADVSQNNGDLNSREIEKIISQSNWWAAQAWFDGKDQHLGGAYGLWRADLGSKKIDLLPAQPMVALIRLLPAIITRYSKNREVTLAETMLLVQKLIAIDISWFLFAKGLGKDAEISLLALRAALVFSSDEDLVINKPSQTVHAEIWQKALEVSFASKFTESLTLPVAQFSPENEVALVTCIDVRSDILRQRAEELAGVCTFGMAGFFGVDISVQQISGIAKKPQNYAPIIVQPSIEISDGREQKFLWMLPALWKSATSGTGALAIAEGFGLLNGILNIFNTFFAPMARHLNRYFDAPRWQGKTGTDISSLSLERKISLAAGILAVVPIQGLREVVFVGHGADASNTPFRSMFECGACGGNNGSLNARFAAALMNDRDVQLFLSDKYGAEEVRFYAAAHNTTLGTLEFDPAALGNAKDGSDVLRTLDSKLSNLPSRTFPGSQKLSAPAKYSASAWWQVFPEWGLSANAACVIGPRQLTKKVNLGSRVFLHDYNWVEDQDGQILASIFSGPGVVMQMINSAYNMAVTDPKNFSSGDKTRHNVIGEAGVILGSEGPLYRGLPWQSIATDANFENEMVEGHIPIRLQIFVVAPKKLIDLALETSELSSLVHGGWIAVHSITPDNH